MHVSKSKNVVAVIGAGPAGVFTARALAESGMTPTLIDAVGPGAGAGGNAVGLVKPFLSQSHDPQFRFLREAFEEASDVYDRSMFAVRSGALDVRLKVRTHVHAPHAAFAQGAWLTSGHAALHDLSARYADQGAVLFRRAYTVQPKRLTEALTQECGGYIKDNVSAVMSLSDGRLALRFVSGNMMHVRAAVLCVGAGVAAFASDPRLHYLKHLNLIKGQVTSLPSAFFPAPAVPLSGDGYVLPDGKERVLIGGTFEKGKDDVEVTQGAHKENILRCSRLTSLSHDLSSVLSHAVGRASVRAVSPMRRPCVGPSGVFGLYVNVGHGSRGWSSAPLAGRLIQAYVARDLYGRAFPERYERVAQLTDPRALLHCRSTFRAKCSS